MKTLTLLSVLAALTTGPLLGQDTPAVGKKDDLGPRVDRLVDALGSEAAVDRETAVKELKKLGAKARPHLEKHRDHDDLEVRMRIRSILDAAPAPAETGKPEVKSRDGRRQLRLAPVEEKDRRDPGGKRVNPRGRAPRLQDFDSMEAFVRALEAWAAARSRADLDGMRHRSLGFSFGSGPGVSRSMSMTWGDETLDLKQGRDGITFKATGRDGNGVRAVKSWTADSMADFKKKYASVYEKYKSSGIFEGTSGLEFRVFGPRDLERGLGVDPFKDMEDMRKQVQEMHERMRREFGFDFGGSRTPRNPFFLDERPSRRAGGKPRLGAMVGPVPADRVADVVAAGILSKGLLVNEVNRGGAGEKAGLKRDDIIFQLAGKSIDSTDELLRALDAVESGSTTTLKVLRGDRIETLRVTLGKKPAPEKKAKPLKKV